MSSPSLFVDPSRRHARGGLVAAIRHRPRIYICALVVLIVYFATPHHLHEATRALTAWNVGAFLYIALVAWMAAHSSAPACRAHAALEDENQWVLLVVGTAAACAALAAIFGELGGVKDMAGLTKAAHVALVAATIVSSWAFIHVLYALHYAHQYYADDDGDPATPTPPALKFPGGEAPTFGDFFYYSFVIGCACQTADVEPISRLTRRTTLAHGIVAFFFNTVVLALTINIGAGLV